MSMASISHSDEIIFRSKLPNIEISDHLPLHSYCFQNLSTNSHRPCLINSTTGAIHTYAEVDLIARRVAAGLAGLDIQKGDVIMILLPNSPEFVFSFLAASHLGAISTTANPFYTPGEIRKQATTSGARIVVTESCHVHKLINIGMKIIVIDDVASNHMPFSHIMSADESRMPTVNINPDDVVALPYSSGTTGLPKGVMLTHRCLITNVAQQVDGDNPNLFFNNQDVILCVLPLFHIYSLISVMLCGLRTGAAILIMRKFDIGVLVDQVERHRVTVAPLVPPIVVEIAKNSAALDGRDLSSIRMLISGAAPMGRDLEEALLAKIPNARLGQGYGMTEAGALSMCLTFAKEPFEVKYGSCGTVVRNAEMKIVDPKTGLSLPQNQHGEICIRGEQIMKGYLNDLESTEQTIDKEGWLHTGDVGYVDLDDEIFIVGRLKEIIKYKGFQVAPAELEALLITHPSIFEAIVIPMKDELAGEVPVAYVVTSNGDEITEDAIKKYIAAQVVFYKRIHKVFFVEAIPKSPSGKILRKDLREKLATRICATGQNF